MRRALLSVFGIAALALAAPGVALAHHHHHHKSMSRAHHARVHFEHISPAGVTLQPGPKSSDEPKSEPLATPSEGAGKIESFTEGVLTIVLNDGSKVSGKVTSDTEIKCEKADMATTPTEGEKESEDGMRTGEDTNVEAGDKGDEGDDNGSGDDGHVEGATEPPCDTTALTPGTEVREAELKVGPSGAEFENIVLVR